MRRWRQGDLGAFEAIVRRWQGPILRLLTRLVGCEATAQDLGQEVLSRLFLGKERYREEGAFSTWLYQIALNLARDAWRRRRPVAPLSEATEKGAAAESLVETEEMSGRVGQAVQELPPAVREVVILRH